MLERKKTRTINVEEGGKKAEVRCGSVYFIMEPKIRVALADCNLLHSADQCLTAHAIPSCMASCKGSPLSIAIDPLHFG